MKKKSKIYIAGNTGLVGSAIIRKLKLKGYNNLVFTPYPEFDLRNQQQVNAFFEKEKPEYVFLAAAKVGGIMANSRYKAEFIYDNMLIEFNVIHAAYTYKVKKLLFLGSSCIYPKICLQPIKEEYLLTGSLEETNEPYAIAKISGLKMCDYYREQYGCDFISAMPTNLYGPNDNYNLETSHVLPAMIRKMHLAKLLENNDFDGIRNDLSKYPFSVITKYYPNWTDEEIIEILQKYGIKAKNKSNLKEVSLILWGSGLPYREFLHVDDLADALLYLMNNYSDYGHVNVGTGKDLQIRELAELVKKIIGFKGKLEYDISKPDGTPRKLLDVSKLHSAGWKEYINLDQGIKNIYESYSLEQ
jgi:GDP-L-fucose synthase